MTTIRLSTTQLRHCILFCSLIAATTVFDTVSAGITLTLRNSFSSGPSLEGIDVDSNGNILATNNQVFRRYTQDGALLQTSPTSGIGFAMDITQGAANTIFVADDAFNQIKRYDVDTFALIGSSSMTGSAGVRSITTLTNGNVVVPEFGTDRIFTLTPTGSVVSNFSTGTPFPHGVATDSNDEIFVADQTINTLRKYSSAGSLITSRNFSDPQRVATDAADNVYLADGFQTLRVLDSNLNTLATVSTSGFTEDVAVASNGRVIASVNSQFIQVYDTSFVDDGTISNGSVYSAGITINSSTNTISSGVTATTSEGSDTVVNSGGTLSVNSGGALVTDDVNNAGLFAADGTVTTTGTFNNNSGGTLTGSGTIDGALPINDGSTISPGDSPGTMSAGNTTFGPGGTFILEVNDLAGMAGDDPGWDLLDITGTLDITATLGNSFVIDVDSLTLANVSGDAVNFDDMSDFSLAFVSTTGGITGFAANLFSIDTSGFTNPFSGTFSVAQLGNDLALQYTAAVPEPSSLVILGVAIAGVGARSRRRRNQSA